VKNSQVVSKDSIASTNTIDSQKNVNLGVSEKLKSADSILLISHVGSEYDETKGDIMPEILIEQKLNTNIIKERKKLTGKSINSLIDILSLPTNNDSIFRSRCFDPHQAILIFKNTKISYIDMCFHCWGLRTSDDLNEIIGYEELKWKKIYSFFRQNGFVYEMKAEE